MCFNQEATSCPLVFAHALYVFDLLCGMCRVHLFEHVFMHVWMCALGWGRGMSDMVTFSFDCTIDNCDMLELLSTRIPGVACIWNKIACRVYTRGVYFFVQASYYCIIGKWFWNINFLIELSLTTICREKINLFSLPLAQNPRHFKLLPSIYHIFVTS